VNSRNNGKPKASRAWTSASASTLVSPASEKWARLSALDIRARDAVNLSSRLEGLNKDYGTHIIVNESTHNAVKDANFVFRELDLIRVKGKHQPVTIYELVWPRRAKLHAEPWNCSNTHGRPRDTNPAAGKRPASIPIHPRIQPDRRPARTYWKRCQDTCSTSRL